MSKRFFWVPGFFNYAIADGIYNLLFSDKTVLQGTKPNTINSFHLRFELG